MRLLVVDDETAARIKDEAPAAVEVPVLEEVEDVVVRLMPAATRVPGKGVTEQARRNAALRQAFLDRHELLDAAAVAEWAGSRSSNRRAQASRWAAAKRIFGVPAGGHTLYPGFQFDDDGHPRPAVADVLKILAEMHLSAWATAIWWDTPSDVLGWRRPAEVVAVDPDEVIAAARIDARSIGA